MNNYVNYIKTKTDKVSAVCQCCGHKSKGVNPDSDGEPNDLYLADGWSVTPFSHDEKHNDGSNGAFYTCPDCNKKLHAGQSLKLRDYDASA